MRNYFRLGLILLLIVVGGCSTSAPAWPEPEWKTSTPEKQGMDSSILQSLEEKIPTTVDIVIVRNGYIVYDYHNDADYQWGMGGMPGIFSITKSITSALIGIAIDEGFIQGVEQAVTDFYPEWAEVNPGWEDVTLQHLLTMTGGFDWPEATTWNYSTMPMRETENWVDFVVGREFNQKPGTTFNYSTGASQLLAAIVQKATGQSVLDYAREKLFDPIGIGDVVWEPDPQGIHAGGRGIWMSARDLARYGLLYLNNGSWDGHQIVSEEYVQESTKPRIKGWAHAGEYGYHWWVSSALVDGKAYQYYYGLGFGGQFLFVVPELNLVTVLTAQNPESSMTGKSIFDRFVLGSIKE